MQNSQLNNSIFYGQDKINQYKLTLDIYHQLESMGFGFKEIEQLRNTILTIAKANNIPNEEADLKFFKDVEEQYDDKLGFKLKTDEKRKELSKLNNQIINSQYVLKATLFVGPTITNLFQKGVFEQDILAISQLIEEFTNDDSIYQDNKNNNNNNDRIKKNVSKAEKFERLLKDIRNYKNIKIEIKEKEDELDLLQTKVNDLYNQRQQIEKHLQNFKSMINSINNKVILS